MSLPNPPVAPRRPHQLTAHGHTRVDDWYWLADRDDPAVEAYLTAENEYASAVLAPTGALQDELFEAIRSRVHETDAGAPSRHGPWWYYSRTVEGKQYPQFCRRPDPERALSAAQVAADARSGRSPEDLGEKLILDENELAGDSDYFAIGVLDISPDQKVMAYATDTDGSENYTLRFRHIESGVDLEDTVEGIYYGSAWASDNQTFFYVRPDSAMRPWQVWRHELGGTEDRLVFQEDDERFFAEVELSRSQQRIVINTSSKTTSESWWMDAADPGDPQVILARQPGVEYDVDHDRSGWLVRSNQAGPDGGACPNFALYRLAEGSTEPALVVPHRSSIKLESAESFAGFVVLAERSERDGLERLRIISRSAIDAGGTIDVDDETGQHLIEQPEPVYCLLGDANAEWACDTYRFGYTSLVTPRSSIEYDVAKRQRTTVWSQIVPGGYDPTQYRTERLWATAPDGVRVPISVVVRAEAALDGSTPCLLYGYGSYEASMDPSFSFARLNLLERGACFAIAHVRGGGELGRAWYEQGRMEHKTNTFSDFIAAAEHLVESGWARPDGLVARGGSAGGLLMGVIANWRPELWRAIIAEVPFVDVVTTMSNTDLPLTVTEWEEWGDPVHDPDAYHRMLAYSPYDNVEVRPYPAMFVTAGLNDPRVGYWEPAKWVAKLRAHGAGGDDRPVILRTEMGAGHQGSSGRYDAWRDEARVQAFVLTQMGLA
jgi:oligopeptidase B